MPAQRKGVYTVPGVLTHFLEELDIGRSQLAGLLGVSVRTVYNIEYGRKRVDRSLLARVAELLNHLSRQKGSLSGPLGLTADNFINQPDSIANICLQSILQNSAEFLYLGDRPLASPDLRWCAPGKPDVLPFAGEYRGIDISKMFAAFFKELIPCSFDSVDILKDCRNSQVTVRTTSQLRHRRSGNDLSLKIFFEIYLRDNQIQWVDSTCDTLLLAEFLASGRSPRLRKSQ